MTPTLIQKNIFFGILSDASVQFISVTLKPILSDASVQFISVTLKPILSDASVQFIPVMFKPPCKRCTTAVYPCDA